MNTCTWEYSTIEVSADQISGCDDVIKSIHWRLTAVSDDEVTATAYGSCALDDPKNADEFIEFNSVTRDQMKVWALEKISSARGQDIAEADLIAALDAQINEQRTPKLIPKVPAGWGHDV